MNHDRHFGFSRSERHFGLSEQEQRSRITTCTGACDQGRACNCVPDVPDNSRYDDEGSGLLRGLAAAVVAVIAAFVMAMLFSGGT